MIYTNQLWACANPLCSKDINHWPEPCVNRDGQTSFNPNEPYTTGYLPITDVVYPTDPNADACAKVTLVALAIFATLTAILCYRS